MATKFPPLYECADCGASVVVIANGMGEEPTIVRPCGHEEAVVYANRKVILHGKGDVNVGTRAARAVTLTLRQLLSRLTGRSI